VRGTTAEGFDDYIRVKWELNTDCGIDQYLVYRSLCDRGKWYPCPPKNAKGATAGEVSAASNGKRGDCGGALSWWEYSRVASPETRGNPTYFDDHFRSARFSALLCVCRQGPGPLAEHQRLVPGPNVPPEIIICQRLRDRTPPEPAIVAGLFARDDSIQVDLHRAAGADIAAYHVYRSDSGQFASYHWWGG